MCRCPANKMFFHSADFTFHSSVRHLPYPQTLQRRFTHSSPTQLHTLFRHPCHHFSPGRAYTFSPKQVLQTSASSALLVPADSPCFPASERSCAGAGQTQLAGGPYLGSVIIEKSTAYFPDALGRRTKELPQSYSLPLVPPPNPGINPFTSMFVGQPLAGRLHRGEIPDTYVVKDVKGGTSSYRLPWWH